VGCEVLIPVIYRLELAAINGDDRMAEQLQLATERDKLLAGVPNARAIVATKVGDGLEVGCQVTG